MLTSNNITTADKAPAALRGIIMAKNTGKVYQAAKRKVSPPHPGEHVAAALEESGLTVYAAAKAMRLRSAQTLHNIVNDGNKRSAITVSMALRLGRLFGNGPDIWLALQQDYDVWNAERDLGAELKAIKPVTKETMKR